jgi:hypothetical protein
MSPFVLAVAILVVVALIRSDTVGRMAERGSDNPPTIEFTWSPASPADLNEVRGKLFISDDYGLDFTTYEMTLVELERSLDLPIEGLVGKQYEQDIFLGLVAEEFAATGAGHLTLEFVIADDRGQWTEVTRKIEISR